MDLLHKLVCLTLSETFFTIVHPYFYSFYNAEWIQQPKERSEKGIQEKHDSLLLNYSVLMSVVVAKSNSLYCKSHQRSCEE